MTKQAVMNLLGLAQRARKLTTGETFVMNAIRDGKAKLVFVASDASANTLKNFSDKSSYYETPMSVALTKSELSHAIGQSRALVAVLDAGFANHMKKLLT